MVDRQKVIKGLEHCLSGDGCKGCPYSKNESGCSFDSIRDAIVLLKEQEGYVSVPFSWLVKFCTHIDFVKPLTDAEREVAWRQKLRQQFGINVSKGGEVG